MNIWKVKKLIDEEAFASTFLACDENKSDVGSWKSLQKLDSFRIEDGWTGFLIETDQLNDFSVFSLFDVLCEFYLIVSS